MSASIKKSAHHMVAGFFKDVAIRLFLNGFFTLVNRPLLVKFVVHDSRASRTGKSKLSFFFGGLFEFGRHVFLRQTLVFFTLPSHPINFFLYI